MKRGGPLARRSPLVSASTLTRSPMAKRRTDGQKTQDNRRRAAYEIVAARSGGRCESVGFNGAGRCPMFANQKHHRRPRGAGGSRLASTEDPSNLIAVCYEHHTRAESLRRRARDEEGWLVRQGHNPATTPVLLFCGRVYLTSDGRYERNAA